MPCETGKTRLMVPDKTLTILPPALEGEAGALTELFHIYEAAMKVIAVRLEILDAEFKNLHDHNPIHHTEARVKSLDSILQKLERKGLDPTIENIQHYITDVAGLRIVCPYVDDIYLLDNLLSQQEHIVIVRRSDYIEHPKPNGYRSLHLIVRVPVPLADRTAHAPVEIQLRTIAMDMWASLEHELRYKSTRAFSQEDANRLRLCSEAVFEVDREMQNIYKGKPAEYEEGEAESTP